MRGSSSTTSDFGTSGAPHRRVGATSGSGEHAAYFAKRLPTLLWQPTDSIRAHLRVSLRIERRLMSKTCFRHCGVMRCRRSGRFNTPMR